MHLYGHIVSHTLIHYLSCHPLIASKVPSPAMTIRFGRRMLGWCGWRMDFLLQAPAKNWTTASVQISCLMKNQVVIIFDVRQFNKHLNLSSWCSKVNFCVKYPYSGSLHGFIVWANWNCRTQYYIYIYILYATHFHLKIFEHRVIQF